MLSSKPFGLILKQGRRFDKRHLFPCPKPAPPGAEAWQCPTPSQRAGARTSLSPSACQAANRQAIIPKPYATGGRHASSSDAISRLEISAEKTSL